MPDQTLVTIQSDSETRERLRKLAEYYERSMAGQLRWLVSQEYNRIFNDSETTHAPTAAVLPEAA